MGFKLKGEPYDKDDMNISVYRKNLDDGSAAKSNHTGIVLQTGLSTEMEGAAIEHEKVHQYQQRRGDLDYDENNFYWKGKTYPRKNLNEHNAKLPWEVEAYKESNKILNGKQTNKQMEKKFQLRKGKGNKPSFENLTSKGLMGASLDTDPINPVKPSEIATTGSKEAQQQKADLAKIGVEKEVKLKPNELGVYSGDKDLGVKKYTSFYKTSDPKLKEKGNKFWSSLSEPEKQEIRDRKSRYEKAPIKMDKISAKLIKTSSNLDIKRVPLKTPGEFNPPDRSMVKSRKEIKRETLSQYGPVSRNRRGVAGLLGVRNKRGQLKESKVLTKMFKQRTRGVMSASAEKHYDEQLALRKEKKHANRQANKFLSRNEKTKDYRGEYNMPGNIKVQTKTFTKKVKLGKNRST